MHAKTFCALLLVGFATVCLHAEDDVESTLAVARFQRLSKLGEATEALNAAIDAKMRAVANTGNLQAVKSIRDEKLKFENDDVLPSSEELSDAVDTYLAARKQASTDLVKAYRVAVAEYTKLLEIDKAEALDREMKQFIADERKVFNRSVAQAKPSDSVLSKAKQTYAEEMKVAKEEVLETMKNLSQRATRNGNLDQARDYDAVAKYFETRGVLPESRWIPIQQAKKEFQADQERAASRLGKAYWQIIQRYKEAGQNAEVAKLEAELERLTTAGEVADGGDDGQPAGTNLNEVLVKISEACRAAEAEPTFGRKQMVESSRLKAVFDEIQGKPMTAKFRVRSVRASGRAYHVDFENAQEVIGTGISGNSPSLDMALPRDIALNLAADDVLVMSGRLDLETNHEWEKFPSVIRLGTVRSGAASQTYYIFLRNVKAQFFKGGTEIP